MIFPLAFPTLTKFRGVHDPSYEYALHKRDVQLGADGSVVRGGDWVYVLGFYFPLDERIKQIDYFHGWNIAQMNDEYESDIPQRVMIPLCYHTAPGILTRRIIAIQRLWRKTWPIRHEKRIIELAEGGVWKHERAFARECKHRLRLRELAAGREPCISTFICAACETRCVHDPVGDSVTLKCKQCCGAMLEIID